MDINETDSVVSQFIWLWVNLHDDGTNFKLRFRKKLKVFALGKVVLAAAAAVWSKRKEINCRIFHSTESTKVEVDKNLHQVVQTIMQSCTWKVNGDAKELKVQHCWDLIFNSHPCSRFAEDQ